MFDSRHYKDPLFWACMFCVLAFAGVAVTGLLIKRLFGVGYGWWEHGSERCKV